MFISKKEDLDIKLKNKPLVIGTRSNNGLWKIPLPPAEAKEMNNNRFNNFNHLAASSQRVIEEMKKKVPDINHIALSAYNQKTAEDLAKYLHACAGYPVKETCVKAIAKGYYSTNLAKVRSVQGSTMDNETSTKINNNNNGSHESN